MKIVLSIIAVIIVIGLCSTGAFVPETRSMVETVAGLKVLSNAEMAQQIGGTTLNKTQRLKESGHNSKITWCATDWDFSCYPNWVVEWSNNLFDCIWCATSKTNIGAYNQKFGAEIEGESWCEYSNGNCSPVHDINYGNNCIKYITQHCNP